MHVLTNTPNTPNMPDTPDMEDLARRYMDLSQEHLNTLASDQDTTKVMPL